MAIALTEQAASRIREQLARRGRGMGLRLGVKTSGCSGYSYVIDYADEINEGDQVFEQHGARVVIDPRSLPLLEGTTLDFRREGLNQVFRFIRLRKARDFIADPRPRRLKLPDFQSVSGYFQPGP
jgi:iron-sulfur cluster assembly protein